MLPCCGCFSKTVECFSSLCLCRRNSDGLTFESDEHTLLLRVGVFEVWPTFDGDAGVSIIVVGVSAIGPTRRATFGGGLKLDQNKYNQN